MTKTERKAIRLHARKEVGSSTFYKLVKGFPDYRIGKDGSICSFRFTRKGIGRWKPIKGKIQKVNNNRLYRRVCLHNFKANRHRLVFIHVLVLEAFVGPKPVGKRTCHWDDNGLNNALENLRWDTQSNNYKDFLRNGGVRKLPPPECYFGRRGENHFRTKFRKQDIFKIRSLAKQGILHRDIAKQFGIARCHVTGIVNNRSWKHV